MKCPACGYSLTEITAGSIQVDVCKGGCGGVWFDNFELKQVDEQHEEAGEILLNIEKGTSRPLDPNAKRACPKCDGFKMKRHFFDSLKNVEIDSCGGCGGVWLDAGELETIRNSVKDEAERDRIADANFAKMFDGQIAAAKEKSAAEWQAAKNRVGVFSSLMRMFGRR